VNANTTGQRVNFGTNTQLFVYTLQFGNFTQNKGGSLHGCFAALAQPSPAVRTEVLNSSSAPPLSLAWPALAICETLSLEN
jgi:hypothetical protein